jgi:hypothetical protein
MVEYARKNICHMFGVRIGISIPRSPRRASLPPNGRVTSGRIFRSEPQNLTDIILKKYKTKENYVQLNGYMLLNTKKYLNTSHYV